MGSLLLPDQKIAGSKKFQSQKIYISYVLTEDQERKKMFIKHDQENHFLSTLKNPYFALKVGPLSPQGGRRKNSMGAIK